MGIRRPAALMISAVAWIVGFPLVKVRRKGQAPSQMFARNTSEHSLPRASCFRTPSDPFGGPVEFSNSPVTVNREDALVDGIEDWIVVRNRHPSLSVTYTVALCKEHAFQKCRLHDSHSTNVPKPPATRTTWRFRHAECFE